MLPRVKDYMFKPTGVELVNFPPNENCVRLREFVDGEKPSSLIKITVIRNKDGYSDKKKKLKDGKTQELQIEAKKMGFEGWGVFMNTSFEYDLKFAQVLLEKLTPTGKFLKIESETQEGLKKTLALLGAKKEERISKNAAVLLAEKLKLI
ncbi:hypothetical protein KKB40_01035 [Patescibacteria group bacterium]|nr:hypothetical protein [Patescibacteria group bacterium]